MDSETGLQYNRGRFFDARSGRWTSEDLIGFSGGDSNLYRYLCNDPTNGIDHSGYVADLPPNTLPTVKPPEQVILDGIIGIMNLIDRGIFDPGRWKPFQDQIQQGYRDFLDMVKNQGNPPEDDKKLTDLINQLRSANFKDREDATNKLIEYGPRAGKRLLEAQKNDPDLEVRRRAEAIRASYDDLIRSMLRTALMRLNKIAFAAASTLQSTAVPGTSPFPNEIQGLLK